MTDEVDNTEVTAEETVVETVEQAPKKTVETKVKEAPKPKPQAREAPQAKQEEGEEDDHSNDLKYENIKRRKENQDLKKQMADLQRMLQETREESERTKQMQQDRLVKATLSNALSKAGCVDPETALALLAKDVEFTKDGDVGNTEDLVNDLKKNKAYFFTGPATSQASPTPRATQRPVNAREMDDKEFDKLLKSMGVKTAG